MVPNTDNATVPVLFSGPLLEPLSTAETIDDLGDRLQAACDGLGLTRYLILRFVGISQPRIAQIVHNADDAGTAEIDDPASLSAWPVLQRMRKFKRPMTFGVDALAPGPAGFGRGAAAISHKSRSTCIAVLCNDGLDLRSEDARLSIMSTATVMAQFIHDSLAEIMAKDCPLTGQELQCLARAMAGEAAKETARSLDLGVRTVEEYLARARKKLGANTSMGAGVTAVDHGWLSLDQIRELAA